jgi:chaperonin GroES
VKRSLGFPVAPLGDNVYAERLADDEGYVHGLDPRMRQHKGLRAKVIAVGPGAPRPDGSVVPMEVKVGDVIFIPQASGVDCRFGTARDIVILRERDILAVAGCGH